jgi:hypothetical protein
MINSSTTIESNTEKHKKERLGFLQTKRGVLSPLLMKGLLK